MNKPVTSNESFIECLFKKLYNFENLSLFSATFNVAMMLRGKTTYHVFFFFLQLKTYLQTFGSRNVPFQISQAEA